MVKFIKKYILTGYGFIIIAALGFSVKSPLVKYTYLNYDVDAVTLALMRLYTAVPFFLLTFFIMERDKGLFTGGRRDMVITFVMGVIGVGCAILFFFFSVELIEASIASLIVYTYPVLTFVLMYLYSGYKVTRVKVMSLLVTFMGLGFVLKIGVGGAVNLEPMGVMFALMAALCYAIYNVLSEKALSGGFSPVRVVTYAMCFAIVFFGLSFGFRAYPVSLELWGIALVLGFVSTYIPFLFYIYGVKHIGADKSVIVSSIGPIFVVTWTSMFLGETLDLTQFAGMALIIFGVIMVKVEGKFFGQIYKGIT